MVLLSEFENIIVKTDTGGRITRLKDVARIELGAQTYGARSARLNGAPSSGVGVQLSPTANALATANEAVDCGAALAVLRALQALCDERRVERLGFARATRYRLQRP